MEKKKLAPLNDAGPTQLLNVQIQKLEQENSALKLRIKTVNSQSIIPQDKVAIFLQVESQATEILESKLGLKMELEKLQKSFDDEKVKEPQVVVEDNSEELDKVKQSFYQSPKLIKKIINLQLNKEVFAARQELIVEKQLSEKSHKDLETDLVSAKHR